MTDEQLRVLIREEIARALQRPDVRRDPPQPGQGPSHAMFALTPPREDGACVIEPAVACTHCGYCRSLGH